eukprot:2510472-Rhodomonas_salina.3
MHHVTGASRAGQMHNVLCLTTALLLCTALLCCGGAAGFAKAHYAIHRRVKNHAKRVEETWANVVQAGGSMLPRVGPTRAGTHACRCSYA